MGSWLPGARRYFGVARCLTFFCCVLLALNCLGQPGSPGHTQPEPGLLFYLSGDRDFKADYAAGANPDPNFLYDVKIRRRQGLLLRMWQQSVTVLLGSGQHLLAARHAYVLLATP
jgi:hypothetical protein